MKRFFFFLMTLHLAVQLYGQVPNGMFYQVVLRDSTNKPLDSVEVLLRLSVLEDTITGNSIFTEVFTVTTNETGLIQLEIGNGTAQNGQFSDVNWREGPFFLKSEVDFSGSGSNYGIEGYTKLLNVPFAYYANLSSNADSARVADSISISVSSICDALLFGNTGQHIIIPGLSTLNSRFPDGYVHCDSANPTVIKTVMNPVTGRTWMDRNLDAQKIAESIDDTASFGGLFQWGRFADGHQCRNSETIITSNSSSNGTLVTTAVPNAGNIWDGKFIRSFKSTGNWFAPADDNLWQGVSGVNNPCPSGGFRVPTKAEWSAERATWSEDNRDGAFGSPLKLPPGGSRNNQGDFFDSVGSNAYYWASTIEGDESQSIRALSSFVSEQTGVRALGFSIRCIKD